MAYNPNLAYFLTRLQGVSTNYFRLEPQNTTTASANKIIKFSLPSNCLLNTKSLSLMFNADANGVAGAGGRLPAGLEMLIDRYELSSGGIQIAQGFNQYGVFCKAKNLMCGERTDKALAHPEIVRATSYVDGSAITTTNNEVYSSDANRTQFCLKHWEGFLGSVNPSIIDTSLLSDCVLTLYLAGNEVLSSSAGVNLSGAGTGDIDDDGTGTATWNMKNFHLVVETIGLADGVLDNLVARRMSEVGYIELPYKTYYSFSDTHSGNTRFSVASQSLDRVWAVWRSPGYDSQKAPVVVNGYKITGSTEGQYDDGVFDTDREKYNGVYYNFKEDPDSASVPPTYQFNFNGSFIPQFKAQAEQMLAITRNSVPTLDNHKYEKLPMSLDQYKNNFFVQCVRLTLPEAEEGREIAGVDTRGIALNAYFATTGLKSGANTPNLVLFAETTSTMRVGEGRAIEIIH